MTAPVQSQQPSYDEIVAAVRQRRPDIGEAELAQRAERIARRLGVATRADRAAEFYRTSVEDIRAAAPASGVVEGEPTVEERRQAQLLRGGPVGGVVRGARALLGATANIGKQTFGRLPLVGERFADANQTVLDWIATQEQREARASHEIPLGYQVASDFAKFGTEYAALGRVPGLRRLLGQRPPPASAAAQRVATRALADAAQIGTAEGVLATAEGRPLREVQQRVAGGMGAGLVFGAGLGAVAEAVPVVSATAAAVTSATRRFVRRLREAEPQTTREAARAAVEAEAPAVVSEAARRVPQNGVQDAIDLGEVPATQPRGRTPEEVAARVRQVERARDRQAEILNQVAEGQLSREEGHALARAEWEAMLRADANQPAPERFGIQTSLVEAYPSVEAMLQEARARGAAGGAGGRVPPALPPQTGGPLPFKNPDVGEFLRRSSQPPSRSFSVWESVVQGFRKRFILFPELRDRSWQAGGPLDRFFADAREALRRGITAPVDARNEAVNILQHITQGLNTRDLELLRRSIVLLDLNNAATRGLKMPTGRGGRPLTNLDIWEELDFTEALVSRNPQVQEALLRHVKFIRTVEQDMVRRGVLDPATVQANPYYFHHQLLDWMGDYWTGMKQPSRLRRARRGYTEQRSGSLADYYTDYLEVMFGHYAKVLRDNRVDDVLQQTAGAYDLTLRPMPDRLAALNKRLQDYQIGRVPLREGQQMPMTVRELPEEDLLAEGYTSWNLGAERMTARPRTAAETLAMRVLDNMLDDPQITSMLPVRPDLVRQALQSRANRTIIPTELANTLNTFREQFMTEPNGLTASAIRGWKQAVLNTRPIVYNRRNLLGDYERTFAAMPSALRILPRVVRDQAKNLRGQEGAETISLPDGRTITRYQLAQERGVVSAGKTALEVGRLRAEVEEFAHFLERPGREAAAHPLRTYSRVARKISVTREDWLRLATFYRNLDRIAEGKPLEYGVSEPRIVDALTDPIDRAAKVSRDTLGDYAGLTAYENGLRNGLMPFYAWLKINSTFWPQLVARQGLAGFSRGAGLKGAATTAWLSSRVMLGYSLLWSWNNLVMGDVEAKIPRWQRERLFHLNLPFKNSKGQYFVLTDPTAFSDFFETLGLEGLLPDLRELNDGTLTFEDFLKRGAYNVATGPVRAIVNRFGPEVQIPLAAVGISLFPDPLNPRELPRGQRLVAALQNAGVPATAVDALRAARYNVDIGTFLSAAASRLPSNVSPVAGVELSQTPEQAQMSPVQQEELFALREAGRMMQEDIRQQALLMANLSRPGLTPQERAFEMRVLDAVLRGDELRLERRARRVGSPKQ